MDPLLDREESGDILEDGVQASRHQTPEKHLDSAITVSLLERLQRFVQLAESETPGFKRTGRCNHRESVLHRCLNRHPELQFSDFRRYVTSYSRAMDFCIFEPTILDARDYPILYRECGELSVDTDKLFRQANHLYDKELGAYLQHLKDVVRAEEVERVRAKLSCRLHDNVRLHAAAGRARVWSDAVDHYRGAYGRNPRPKKVKYSNLKVVACEGFVLLKLLPWDTWRLATFEQLQMIQDAMASRYHVESALQFGFHNGSASLARLVDEILTWQEKVLTSYGNEGFVLVKAPEAVFKTHLTSLSGGDILEYSSYSRTIDKVRAKEAKLDDRTPLTTELDALVQQVTSIHDAAELFGLTKLSGHPTVYPSKSAKTVQRAVKAPKTCSVTHIRYVTRTAKHLILSGYIRVHSDWPPMLCPPPSNTELGRHYRNRVTTLNLGSYPLSEIDTVVFGKFIEFDYSEDYLKLLDDKAICPGAAEMSKFWFGGSKHEPRRLLQKILTMTEFDTRALIDRVRSKGFLEDELVIELTQKEREFKDSARCFAKMTIEMRALMALLEYNIKEQFLKKYIPHQTMTMSNADEKKRLYHLVREATARKKCLVEGDYSSWNLAMCPEVVDPISYELNDIFGMDNTFNLMHAFFSKATIVLADKHTLPEGADPTIPITQWPESDLVWRSHKNGLEGLGQGQWSFVTIALCVYCTSDLDVSYNMALQGDNVIFAFHFNNTELSVAVQLQRLLARMEIRSRWLNHTVKPEECIDSFTVLTYSKEIYVNGAQILYNLKFASRSFRRDEIDVPSLGKEVAAANATAMACADSVYITAHAIFWKHWLVLNLFDYRSRCRLYTSEHRLLKAIAADVGLREFVFLLPGSLGGLPMMPWTRFFMKGELDDLSWDVAAVLSLQHSVPQLGSDMRHLLRGEYSPTEPDLTQLLLDPHSIPLNRPKDMARLIKDEVAASLPGLAKNRDIKQIVSHTAEGPAAVLLSRLCETRPFYPQIMADIYKLSPAGVRDSLFGRFVMTRTITRITNSTSFIGAIAHSNQSLLRSIRNRSIIAVKEKLPATKLTPYACCKALRRLWGDCVENRCIGVYTPFDFKLGHTPSGTSRISASTRAVSGEQMLTTAGPYAPNFGTKTRQKMSSHGFRILSSSSTVQDLKALTMIWSELGSDGSLAQLLDGVAYARCPWSLPTLGQVLPTSYGGSAAHRHQQLDSKHFAVLGSKTVPTHLNLCSDQAGVLSGGERDIPLAYQPFYLTLTSVFQTLAACGADIDGRECSYILSDDYEELPEEPVKCPIKTTRLRWPSHLGNPLAYVSRLQMKEIPRQPPRDIIRHIDPESILARDLVYSCLLQRYGQIAIKSAARGLITQPVDLFDLKEFNHIPLTQLLQGASAFAQCVAINACATASLTLDTYRLVETLNTASTAVAGLLGRLIVHKSNSATMFAQRQELRLLPGAYGAIHASDQLRGHIVEMSIAELAGRKTAVKRRANLILFEEYERNGVQTVLSHALYNRALDSKTATPTIGSKDKMALRSVSVSRLTSACALLRIGQLQELYSQQVVRQIRGADDEIATTKLSLSYCPTSEALALRARRAKRRDVRPLAQPTRPPAKLPKRKAVQWESHFEVGALPVNCECENSDRGILLERVLNMLQRPIGVYASAVTVWAAVIQQMVSNFRGRDVVSIGVGHGAVARCSLDSGCSTVTGIDLRSSFPISAQREGTYIPPEVYESGRPEDFEWSGFVASHGGDVSKDGWEKECDNKTVVIDIENTAVDEHRILWRARSAATIIHRFTACEHRLRGYLDAYSPRLTLCLSSVAANAVKTYVCVLGGVGSATGSNWTRTRLTSLPIEPLWWPDPPQEDVLRLFNSVMRPTGRTITGLNSAILKDVERELSRDVLNLDQPGNVTRWTAVLNDVRLVLRLLELPPMAILDEEWGRGLRMYCRLKATQPSECRDIWSSLND